MIVNQGGCCDESMINISPLKKTKPTIIIPQLNLKSSECEDIGENNHREGITNHDDGTAHNPEA